MAANEFRRGVDVEQDDRDREPSEVGLGACDHQGRRNVAAHRQTELRARRQLEASTAVRAGLRSLASARPLVHGVTASDVVAHAVLGWKVRGVRGTM